jgi:hypothetical protein
MNLGYTTSGRYVPSEDDEPTSETMRGNRKILSNPSTDQKKVRRAQQRKQSRGESMNFRQKESALLRAMASAKSLREQAVLAEELDKLRNSHTAAIQEEKDLSWADTVVRDTLTPVMSSTASTTASDWIDEVVPHTAANAHSEMMAEASVWYNRVSPEVKADREEFAEQAQGMARRLAGKFGEAAPSAQDAFLQYTSFLYQREAASGLDQVQEIRDAKDNPKTTPLPKDVFDTFAEPLAPGNSEGKPSTDNPLIQEILSDSGQGGGRPSEHDEGEDLSNHYGPPPVQSKDASQKTAREHQFPCGTCGAPVSAWGGQDTECDNCGTPHNGFGQRLRSDWRGNSSNYDEDMGDMEGFENQHHYDAAKHASLSDADPFGFLPSRSVALSYSGSLDDWRDRLGKEAEGNPYRIYPHQQSCPNGECKLTPHEGPHDFGVMKTDPHTGKDFSDIPERFRPPEHQISHYMSSKTAGGSGSPNSEPPSKDPQKCFSCGASFTAPNDVHTGYCEKHRDGKSPSDSKMKQDKNRYDTKAGESKKANYEVVAEYDVLAASSLMPAGPAHADNKDNPVNQGWEAADTDPAFPDVALPPRQKTQPGTGGGSAPSSSGGRASEHSEGPGPEEGKDVKISKKDPDGDELPDRRTKQDRKDGYGAPKKVTDDTEDEEEKKAMAALIQANRRVLADMFGASDSEHKTVGENRKGENEEHNDKPKKAKDVSDKGDMPVGAKDPKHRGGDGRGSKHGGMNLMDAAAPSANAGTPGGGQSLMDAAQSGGAPPAGPGGPPPGGPQPGGQDASPMAGGTPPAGMGDVAKSGPAPSSSIPPEQQQMHKAPSGSEGGSSTPLDKNPQSMLFGGSYQKAYKFAKNWTPGTPLVGTGDADFERGLYDGIKENHRTARAAWVAKHKEQSERFPYLAERLYNHARRTAQLKTAATDSDLSTIAPASTPSESGNTPLSGPGRKPPLDGRTTDEQKGSPAPYNGAPPYGSPVVPGAQQKPPASGPDDKPARQKSLYETPGRQNTNPQTPSLTSQQLAFRQRVQASLLAETEME